MIILEPVLTDHCRFISIGSSSFRALSLSAVKLLQNLQLTTYTIYLVIFTICTMLLVSPGFVKHYALLR